ncbi:hypothetical protein LCGC14_0608800 [marine sediment metagenome]|uniref:Uncharacterized protein n=1 Tax=marine sediment metagenome TaxID=412755 RepID=A0A0F9R8K9_9ZZZZ
MKNLKTTTDENIYRMLENITFIASAYPTKTFEKMKKQLQKEWERRNISIVPLSWSM